ncbi:MAG: hypothetical protein PHI35_01640 [Victivallaceae bacterium]|nr:hypothetical protein [Victivallaceae bacterium]
MDLTCGVRRLFKRLHGSASGALFYPIFLLVLVLLGFSPLLMPGMPSGHDMLFHLARIQGLADALCNGNIPNYINFDALDGFGYAAGMFYSDAGLLLPAAMAALGVPTLIAYKLFLVLWMIFSAFMMYWAVTRICGSPFAGFCAGLMLAWSSYMACDGFIRAALGEYMAVPFIIMVLLGCYNMLYDSPRKFMPLAIGGAGLLIVHNISTVLTAIAVGLWLLFNMVIFLREPRRIFWLAAAGIAALGVAAFYLFPMAEQLLCEKYWLNTLSGSAPIAPRATPVMRLFIELPYMKMEHWLPPGIGLIFVVVFFQRFRYRGGSEPAERFRDAMLIMGVAALFWATNFLPWEGLLRKLSLVQFPWRSYLIATIVLAMGGGMSLAKLTQGKLKRERKWVWILLFGCGFAWFFTVSYIYAARISEHDVLKSFRLKDAGRMVAAGYHYLPAGMRPQFIKERGAVVKSSAPVEKLVYSRPRRDLFRLEYAGAAAEGVTVELPLIHYRGYRVKFAGENGDAPVVRSADGYVSIKLQGKSGVAAVRYAGTRVQHVSLLVSAASTLLLLLIAILRWRRRAE